MVHLVVVGDGTNVLRRHMPLAAKHLDRAGDDNVLVLLNARCLARLVVGTIQPLPHVNVAGAVANLVRDVGSRRRLVVNRTDELDLQRCECVRGERGKGLGMGEWCEPGRRADADGGDGRTQLSAA